MINKNLEKDKQGNTYLSEIYSEIRRPVTPYPLHLAKEILKRNKLEKKLNLLEVGCGRGDLLKAFNNLGHIVEGADL